MKLEKQKKEQELEFKYDLGNSIIYVNGEIQYLDIRITEEVTYDDIKEHIVK